jgi:SAM-dependent methyltransferase
MPEYFQKESWKVIAQQDLPYLPTPREVIEEIFRFLATRGSLVDGIKLIDLGAGDGRVILYAAEKYGLNCTGVEVNKELINSTRMEIRQKKLTKICKMVEGDLYNFDVVDFQIVFCFILPSSHKHFRHVVEEMPSGAIVVSVRWAFDGFQDFWKQSHQLNPVPDFPVYIYWKK